MKFPTQFIRKMIAYSVLLFLLGCSEQSSKRIQNDSGSIDWQEALTRILASSEKPSFSLEFYGAEKTNTGVRVAGFSLPGNSCLLFQTEFMSPSANQSTFWLMDILLTSSAPAQTYDIRPFAQIDLLPKTASVAIRKIQNGIVVAENRALSGSMTIVEGPVDEVTASSQKSIVLKGYIEFPKHNVLQGKCTGTMAIGVDGGTLATCMCSDSSGEFECHQPWFDLTTSCCFDTQSERIPFEINITASLCPSMCQATGLIYTQRCSALSEL